MNLQKNILTNDKPNLHLKALLFDMDGVLFDSMPNHALSWKEAFDLWNIKTDEHEFFVIEGANATLAVNSVFQRELKRSATQEEVNEIYNKKVEIFKTKPEAVPMKGADKLLRKIKNQGLMAVVVTGSGQFSVIDRIDTTYPNVFDMEKIVTGRMVKQGKPYPDPYLMGMKHCNTTSLETLVIENAPFGIRAAKGAGIKVVAINSGPLSPETLVEAGADFLFESMEELAEKWEALYQYLTRS